MVSIQKQPFFQKGLIQYLILFSLFFQSIGCLAHSSLEEDDQKLFLKAEHAIRTNDLPSTKKYLLQLKKMPLYGYLEYQILKKELKNNQDNLCIFYCKPIRTKHITQYRKRYPDSPLSKSLNRLWLEQQARHKNWDAFLETLDPKDSLSDSLPLQCHKIHAQYHATSNIQMLAPALNIWMATPECPSDCQPLISLLYQHNMITQDKLLDKYQSLLEKKTSTSLELAKQLRLKMDAEHQELAKTWASFIHDPNKLSDSTLTDELTQHKNKILTSSFKHYAKTNVHKAKNEFEDYASRFKLATSEKAQIIKQIALSLALQHDIQALDWFNKIPTNHFDLKTKEWQIRTAIKHKNWSGVLDSINQLDAIQIQQESWQYWKARACEHLGLPYKEIYQSLALKRGYYGFLAAGHLQQSIHLNHNPHPHIPQIMAQIENKPAIARAKALFKLNRPHEAQREWYHMVASMEDIEKTHAARLAKQYKWHHLAIYTFNQSKHKDDVILRFPLAFESIILKQAETHQMDSAWVFAIARQESNFNTLALSPVGAMGLMQLMPKTASSLDKTLSHQLNSPDANIHLGTRYLKSLYEQTHHPIIATASYNAGPSRVKKWLPSEPCEADIWIETIPFEETRNYVKNVLALTCIYKQLQNKSFSLPRIMSPIQA